MSHVRLPDDAFTVASLAHGLGFFALDNVPYHGHNVSVAVGRFED